MITTMGTMHQHLTEALQVIYHVWKIIITFYYRKTQSSKATELYIIILINAYNM